MLPTMLKQAGILAGWALGPNEGLPVRQERHVSYKLPFDILYSGPK